jgi:hypothetical protein
MISFWNLGGVGEISRHVHSFGEVSRMEYDWIGLVGVEIQSCWVWRLWGWLDMFVTSPPDAEVRHPWEVGIFMNSDWRGDGDLQDIY